MMPLVLVKRSIAVYLMVSVFLIAAVQPLAGQGGVAEEDPIARCRRIAARAERNCYLQFEEAVMQVGGAAALACIAGFAGPVTIAILVCLLALGIALSIILNLQQQYDLCIEMAQEDLSICIETNCT